jgi:TolB-like protein
MAHLPTDQADRERTEAVEAPSDLTASVLVSSPSEASERKQKKKKHKARSAWISFTGRIVAQVVGAVATIFLGVYVVDKYKAPLAREVAVARTSPLTPASRMRGAEGQTALAVLPLQNFSGDPRNDAVADGTTEALIAELAQLKGIRVISRTTSMRYKGGVQGVPEIARELDVDWIVEGSIAAAAGQTRVTAQLIDARRDEHVWARSYDQPGDDVLRLQARVAVAIAQAVGGAIAASQGSPRAAETATPTLFDRDRMGWDQARPAKRDSVAGSGSGVAERSRPGGYELPLIAAAQQRQHQHPVDARLALAVGRDAHE